LPVPQFGPLLRFQSPLVKPCKRISRTRLSPIPTGLRSRQVGSSLGDTKKPERFMQVVLRELLKAASVFPSAPHQPVSQSAIDVSADKVIRRHDRPLIEVAAPTAQEAIEPDHLGFRGFPMPSRRCACMDASEQTFDRFPRRACAQIGAPIFSKEPADRIPEERKVVLRQAGNPSLGLVHLQP